MVEKIEAHSETEHEKEAIESVVKDIEYRIFGKRGTVPLFFQLPLFNHVVKMSRQTNFTGFFDFKTEDLRFKVDYTSNSKISL